MCAAHHPHPRAGCGPPAVQAARPAACAARRQRRGGSAVRGACLQACFGIGVIKGCARCCSSPAGALCTHPPTRTAPHCPAAGCWTAGSSWGAPATLQKCLCPPWARWAGAGKLQRGGGRGCGGCRRTPAAMGHWLGDARPARPQGLTFWWLSPSTPAVRCGQWSPSGQVLPAPQACCCVGGAGRGLCVHVARLACEGLQGWRGLVKGVCRFSALPWPAL